MIELWRYAILLQGEVCKFLLVTEGLLRQTLSPEIIQS